MFRQRSQPQRLQCPTHLLRISVRGVLEDWVSAFIDFETLNWKFNVAVRLVLHPSPKVPSEIRWSKKTPTPRTTKLRPTRSFRARNPHLHQHIVAQEVAQEVVQEVAQGAKVAKAFKPNHRVTTRCFKLKLQVVSVEQLGVKLDHYRPHDGHWQ